MSMKKMMHAYTNSDREAVAESNDPVAIVALLFDELIRNMQEFTRLNADTTKNIEARSKHFSKSLSIIYALQSSLNFEEGGEISNNLFRLYEYSRQQMLQDWKEKTTNRTEHAITILDDIRNAWQQISRKGAAE
jgi:flagellar protein FliS